MPLKFRVQNHKFEKGTLVYGKLRQNGEILTLHYEFQCCAGDEKAHTGS